MGNQEVKVENRVIRIDQLRHNENNPRLIKNKKHRELMKSLKEFPEMKRLREVVIDENNLILAGDKRVYALEELGYAEIEVKQVFNLSQDKKDEFIVKDNIHHGDWDADIINNSWEADQLAEWGVPEFKIKGDSDDEDKDYKSHEVTCPECGHHFELSESTD